MAYQKNFEIVRLEDMHLAAALMALDFSLHGCELREDGWVKFCLLVPEVRKEEVEALAAVSQDGSGNEDDIPVPFGAYRKALGELRGVMRQAKGDVADERRSKAGVATP